jgi:hypothetical protein
MNPSMPSEPSEGRSEYAVWAECRDAIWNAQAFACLFAEMSWAVEENRAFNGDKKLEYEHLTASHIRIFAEFLVDELAVAAENIGNLEPETNQTSPK